EWGVCPKPSFAVMDYNHTEFEDRSFDVIWCIESVCHCEDKASFVREASRLLKSGGRLIIADGFTTKSDNLTHKQKMRMDRWLQGWGVKSLETQRSFLNTLERSGFTNIAYTDETSHILPSSKRLYLISWPAYIISKMGEWLRLRSAMQTN